MARFKVVITDFDYGDNDVERSILEPIGARVVALQAKRDRLAAGLARIQAPPLSYAQRLAPVLASSA